jgi:hypothetical protein
LCGSSSFVLARWLREWCALWGGTHEHGATFHGATDRLIRSYWLTCSSSCFRSSLPFVVVFLIWQPTGNKQTNKHAATFCGATDRSFVLTKPSELFTFSSLSENDGGLCLIGGALEHGATIGIATDCMLIQIRLRVFLVCPCTGFVFNEEH